ncbi:MAG: M14 family metallopeptidase [Pseudomonadota bacterium]
MPTPRFDHYYPYAELCDLLCAYGREYPHLVRVAPLGRSYEGRDILVCTVTDYATGDHHSKPALWVDGNIHAAELVGSSAAVYFLHHLVSEFGRDAELTRCLQSRAFYICPRVNPDGAEWALATPPKIVRSSTRPYPYKDDPSGGLRTQDMDGDGRILSMRVPDPNGAWKVAAEDPRLMAPREPTEIGGRYYRLLPEGQFDDYDGMLWGVQARKEQLDLNRNFPARWREEHAQRGAGGYPTSEPEAAAVAAFIDAHANIGGGITFHSYSGVLLRPLSYQDDSEMPAEDLWTYQKIGVAGQTMTGYPAASVYHEFRYHPKETITGALDDWLYEFRGLFAWTVEIWSPQREAGITDYKYIEWYREHGVADDRKMLVWSDQALCGKGYIDWYPYQHPQLGAVELGGWDALYSIWNPPPALLEREIKRFPAWLIWNALILPRLEIYKSEVVALGDGHFRVRVTVHNTGWLPTYITKIAVHKKLVQGVIAELELAAGMRLIAGDMRQEKTQLEGRAQHPRSPFGWGGVQHEPSEDRVGFEWVVSAPRGGTLRVCTRHARAGTAHADLMLQ